MATTSSISSPTCEEERRGEGEGEEGVLPLIVVYIKPTHTTARATATHNQSINQSPIAISFHSTKNGRRCDHKDQEQ